MLVLHVPGLQKCVLRGKALNIFALQGLNSPPVELPAVLWVSVPSQLFLDVFHPEI